MVWKWIHACPFIKGVLYDNFRIPEVCCACASLVQNRIIYRFANGLAFVPLALFTDLESTKMYG